MDALGLASLAGALGVGAAAGWWLTRPKPTATMTTLSEGPPPPGSESNIFDVARSSPNAPPPGVAGRRVATVLFADIRGFTHLSQRRDAALVFSLLDEYTQQMTSALAREEGRVHRILGDGLLAVFGVPNECPDHASKAVRAALQMQAAADRLSPIWEERTGSPLRIVVAIHSGEVLFGRLRGLHFDDLTVLGDTVNVASRLEAEAKALDVPILLTGETARLIEGTFPFRSAGRKRLRGRTGEVELFALGTGRPTGPMHDPHGTKPAGGTESESSTKS